MRNCGCCGGEFAERKGGGVARVVHTGKYEVAAPAGKVNFDLMVRLEAPKGTRVCERCLAQSLIVSLAGLQARIDPAPPMPAAPVIPAAVAAAMRDADTMVSEICGMPA